MYKYEARSSAAKKAERRSRGPASESNRGGPMNSMNYVGLDVHKKSISYCVRQADGTILREGSIVATRQALDTWMGELPQPWMAGMEATMFTGWIYDHLVSRGVTVKVAHSAMLKAIAAGKKKNDRLDARKIADLLRCDYFPECHMAPREIRDRRRVLRYRNLLVRQAVQMKNTVSGRLMEAGVPYNQQKVHQKKYFAELLQKQKKGVSFPCRREFPESTRFRGNARPFLLCYRWNSTTT